MMVKWSKMQVEGLAFVSVLGGWISPRDGVRNLCVWMEPLLA